MMKKSITYTLMTFAAVLSAVVACHEELPVEENLPAPEDSGIRFRISAGGGITRSTIGCPTQHLLLADGTDSLFLTTTVAENTSFLAASSDSADVLTKGTLATTDNLGSFRTSAYLSDNRAYFSDLEVSRSGDGYAHTGMYWPNQALNFFANSHTPSDLTYTVADGACSGSFSYALPAPDATNRNDAAAQEDYIFAIAPGRTDDGNPVDLHFHHAFSAICFKMGSMPAEGRIVNYVGLKNVPSSGNCTFGPDADGGVTFLWTGLEGNGTYTQKIGSDKAAGELINGDGIIFMMLPHELSTAEIVISFTLHDGNGFAYEYVIEKALKDITAEWESDKKYTYTISAPEEVVVEIEDMVTAKVKHDVEISNPGLATTYIRAAIVGAWVNERGEIISPWIGDESRSDADGKFNWGSDWDSHWVKGSDGFYYHKTPVVRGGKTWPLFDTYTLTSSPPLAGSVLELNIVAQAVRYDQLSAAWPASPLTQ